MSMPVSALCFYSVLYETDLYKDNVFRKIQISCARTLLDNRSHKKFLSKHELCIEGIGFRIRREYKTKIINTFPFEGFEMPSERYGSPIYITLDDVQKIYTADLSDFPLLAIQRDIFVFQCNVGCKLIYCRHLPFLT